ncbi:MULTISPECIES: nucleotidyltransferase domain-containing protein [unclassified Spirosoma]|uniref:nucleotidyltransferase family protein n=1 Tax=unclassified Spirosoma TaxID=2621999 RepID=UPI0009670FD9|nr:MULTISPECIES: nucleotidyltransferase domain-containing protein [unclassified Spirosoma]MBN8822905.1 nucleotidyltransferase domain-containing protein [Spirosoma sp.]OJW80093.1 MAG: nucleotidyltransferase [Spirosoma sp. 48-14]
MKLTTGELQVIRSYLRDKPVLRVYVFGSYARNEANKESDLDLLVELDYSRPVGLQFVSMKLDLEEKLSKSVDLVSMNGLSPRIRPFIDQDKQLIYERTVR